MRAGSGAPALSGHSELTALAGRIIDSAGDGVRRFVVGELDGVELTVLSKEVFIAGDLGLGHLEDGASTDVDEELCSGQRCPLRRAVKVCWAANKSFEVLDFNV